MEIDISESKSKSFSIFLRFVQLAASLLLAALISRLSAPSHPAVCLHTSYSLITTASIILLVLSLIAVLVNRCKQQFSKAVFFALFGLSLVVSAIIMVAAFTAFTGDNVCAQNMICYKYTGIQIIASITTTLLVLMVSFFLVQRFSNSPGNIVWPIMFYSYSWTPNYSPTMHLIGTLTLIVLLLTVAVNIVAFVKGITSFVKKLVLFFWIGGLLLMIVAEIAAIVKIMGGNEGDSYADAAARVVLEVFLGINVLQFALWIFGLLTLQYENGDKVRDGLLGDGSRSGGQWDQGRMNQYNQGEEQRGIGTLK